MGPNLEWLLTMELSGQLIALRKRKGWTQQEMADAIGLHVNQIKRYEAGTAQPSIEAIKKIAVAFSVSIDSLLFEAHERGPDEELKLQFEAVSRMTPSEKRVIRELLEGMILKHEARRWTEAN